MLKKALVRIPAYVFYMQGMVTVTIPVPRLGAVDILNESFGFLEDGLIFDDNVIAGLGVRDHELYILRHWCYLS